MQGAEFRVQGAGCRVRLAFSRADERVPNVGGGRAVVRGARQQPRQPPRHLHAAVESAYKIVA